MIFRRGDLVEGCHDDGDGGVVGYGGPLDIRPPSLTMRLELIHCVNRLAQGLQAWKPTLLK